MELFDTHCHLNLVDAFPDWQSEVERARNAGVSRIIVVGIDRETSEKAVEIASQNSSIRAVVGLHPTNCSGFKSNDADWIYDLGKQDCVCAIGEIGLDYHWDTATPADQFLGFEAQLDVARRLNKPVVLHIRDAYDDAIAFLASRHDGLSLDFHCFAGTMNQALELQEWGAYFGFDGPLTFKKSAELRAIAGALKRDRVLLETDSPYLSPHPYRGKPNSPALLPLINAELARVWGVSAEESAQITFNNAMRFFGLNSAT